MAENRLRKIGHILPCGGVDLMHIYQIELTNYCNSKCAWCDHSKMKRDQGFMDWQIFERTVEVLKYAPPPNNTVGLHHFGESLLHPDINLYLQYLENRNINWRLSTNGRLLQKWKSEICSSILKVYLSLVWKTERI